VISATMSENPQLDKRFRFLSKLLYACFELHEISNCVVMQGTHKTNFLIKFSSDKKIKKELLTELEYLKFYLKEIDISMIKHTTIIEVFHE
jgi:hypothetical protein